MSYEWTDPADLQPLTDAASRDAEDLAAASGYTHWWTPVGISVESTPGQEPPDGYRFVECPGIRAKAKPPRRAWLASASWAQDGWTDHLCRTIHARTRLGARWKARRIYRGATTRAVQPSDPYTESFEFSTQLHDPTGTFYEYPTSDR